MSALFFGQRGSPASSAAAGSVSSRSSTWETRRVRVSFERQQRQQPAGGGHHPGAGVAGRRDQGGQVEGDQVGDQQQQPGLGRVAPVGPGGEVQGGGAGQPGVAARGGRRGGGLLGRVAQQPAEAFLGRGSPRRWCG